MKLKAPNPARAMILGSLNLLALIAIAGQSRETVIVPSSGGEFTDATSHEVELVTLLPDDSIPGYSIPDLFRPRRRQAPIVDRLGTD